MSRTAISTSRSAIARYWCLGANDEANRWALHCDWGEPKCWACGWIPTTEFDGNNNAYDLVKGKLERAHLVARVWGGSDLPENLVLLCGTCHASLDAEVAGTDRETGLQWIKGWRSRFHAAFVAEFERLYGAPIPAGDTYDVELFFEKIKESNQNFATPTGAALGTVEALKEVIK